MNSPILYQWNEMIDKGFPQMGRWQKRLLGEFSYGVYGVVLSQSCRLNKVAQELTGRANASSQERRMQRWLANDRIAMKPLFGVWIDWVLRLWGKAPLVILVDETKLSDHVAVMMVGVAYHASAIPLIWRAYSVEDYPEEAIARFLKQKLKKFWDNR